MDQDQDRDESHTIGDKGLGSGRVGGRGGKESQRERERERSTEGPAGHKNQSFVPQQTNQPVCV